MCHTSWLCVLHACILRCVTHPGCVCYTLVFYDARYNTALVIGYFIFCNPICSHYNGSEACHSARSMPLCTKHACPGLPIIYKDLDKTRTSFKVSDQLEFEVSSRAEAVELRTLTDCKKNPGHKRFIPVGQFRKDHLLPGYQDDTLVKCIQALANLTVLLRCPVTSADRPDTFPNSSKPYPFTEYRGSKAHIRFATGWVLYVDREPRSPTRACLCDVCRQSPTPATNFAEIEIRTAAHSVYDRTEAEQTTCYLFFDKGTLPDLDSTKLVSCRKAQAEHDFESDFCDLTFTTHDLELAEKLEKMVSEYQSLHAAVKKKYPDKEDSNPQADSAHKLTVIVSHPHGCSKHISVGEYVKVESMGNRESLTRYSYTTASCPGCSGAPVFVLSRGWQWLWCQHPHSGQWDHELNYSGFALK